MSYSIQVGSKGFEQLASNAGYADFAKWVESLDHKIYGDLVHLYEYGWCQNIADLEKQIDAAKKAMKPSSDSLRATIEGLQQILKDRPTDAVVVTITDGFGDSDESEKEKTVRDRLIAAGYSDEEIIDRVKSSPPPSSTEL